MRTRLLALVLLLVAPVATAGISLDVRRPDPLSPDVEIRWEAEGPGPFTLLHADVSTGRVAADVLPLTQVLMRDLMGPDVIVPDGAVFSPLMDMHVYQLVDQTDGSCSNLAYVALRRGLGAGSIVPLAHPGRSDVVKLSDVLAMSPNVRAAELVEPELCRRTRLERLPGGGLRGIDMFIPPGVAPLAVIGRDDDFVIVGASEFRHAGTRVAQRADCSLAAPLSLPFVIQWEDADQLLCGYFVDADGDRHPDTCDGALCDGVHPADVSQFGRHGGGLLLALLRETRESSAGGLRFNGIPWDVDAAAGHEFRSLRRDPPEFVLATEDGGATAACRCVDSDGDGEDDCTERLYATDPADPSSHGPDADGDLLRDDVDLCPGHPDRTNGNADGDEFGDACDPDPADPLNAAADRDADGIVDGRDACPDDPDPLQADRDGDAIGDECDLCPDVISVQRDTDGDGLGNTCDPCPLELGPDPDRDNICESDNCPNRFNRRQDDRDRDGFGDACDCDDRPRLPGWHGLRVETRVPGTAAFFRELSWAPGDPGDVYDVLAGPLADVTDGTPSFFSAECIAFGLRTPALVDGPRRGNHYYLVRKRSACEATSWGTGSHPGFNARVTLDWASISECR